MKNQLFTVALILMSVFSQAQKIKVKKNQILVDEKAIAKIDDKKRIYTVSTLNDEPKFTAEVKSKKFTDGSTSTWMLISDITNQNTNEIPFDLIFSGLAFEKNIIGNLLKEDLPLLNLDGINEPVLTKFLSDKNERISVKMEQKELDIVERIKQARELYVSKKTTVDKAGNIFCNTVRVGAISRSVEKDALGKDNFSYKVVDSKNILIGEYYTFGGINPETKYFLREELLLVKTKVVPLVFQNILSGTSLDKDKNVENILAAVFINGYELGNQASVSINEIRVNNKEKATDDYNEAMKNSINIYDKPGYVILPNGEKNQGLIYTLFEDIPNPAMNGQPSNFAFKKQVRLQQPDNKAQQDLYKSKDMTTFCVDGENGAKDKCYKGLYVKGEIKLLFDYSMFYEILYDKNGFLVLNEPEKPTNLAIKIPSQENGLYVSNYKKNDKLVQNLAAYLNCNSLDLKAYDLNKVEEVKRLLEDFQSKCK